MSPRSRAGHIHRHERIHRLRPVAVFNPDDEDVPTGGDGFW
jgi:hypothetical protein